MLTGSTGALHAYIKEETIEGIVNITGNGATVLNVFKFTGTVRILNQEAVIMAVTDIVTCSNVYATVYDGTNTKDLTADGIDLSGVSVDTYFTKDKIATETYSLNASDEVRVLETLDDRKAGRPFSVTAKNGVDNFIQFRFTGDANTDFDMFVKFDFEIVNGATIELA